MYVYSVEEGEIISRRIETSDACGYKALEVFKTGEDQDAVVLACNNIKGSGFINSIDIYQFSPDLTQIFKNRAADMYGYKDLQAVTMADMNADGQLDILVSN